MRHRYFLALPFLFLFFGTLIGGQLVIDLTTNNIVGQKALLCAPNHDSKEIDLKGVALVTTLTKHEGVNCPPLPTPSPSPTPLPTASPSVSPTPSPTASP